MSSSGRTTSALDDLLNDESKSLWDEFDLFAGAEATVVSPDVWSDVEMFDLLEHDDVARLRISSGKMLTCRAWGLAKALPKPKREREREKEREREREREREKKKEPSPSVCVKKGVKRAADVTVEDTIKKFTSRAHHTAERKADKEGCSPKTKKKRMLLAREEAKRVWGATH